MRQGNPGAETQRVGPRLAVFSHIPPTSAILERTRRIYKGRVEEGVDLMVIDIGTEVVVHRPPPAATSGEHGGVERIH